ncbi:MAG: nucleoside triphosphate pyrophosphohydrolase [Cellulosilyticum sp.]|nr:nucleoside triphosphate pyrophosphohydrolase [Cellulosilyticum sp.]
MEKVYTYEELVEIIEILRGDNGCPWDREQTHKSLISCLLEESYELVEALENEDTKLMEEELGDVLLQVLMHAQIAKEAGAFGMEEVVNGIATKLVHRHPHVFKEGQTLETADQVSKSWEEIKKKEKKEETVVEAMDRVAKTLPALMRTQKVQKKVVKSRQLEIGDIEQIDELIDDLKRLKTQCLQAKNEDIECEIGKILFSVVKLSTFFDINAEFALTKSLEKFINRFRYIENTRFPQD